MLSVMVWLLWSESLTNVARSCKATMAWGIPIVTNFHENATMRFGLIEKLDIALKWNVLVLFPRSSLVSYYGISWSVGLLAHPLHLLWDLVLFRCSFLHLFYMRIYLLFHIIYFWSKIKFTFYFIFYLLSLIADLWFSLFDFFFDLIPYSKIWQF